MTDAFKGADPFKREQVPIMVVISGPSGVGKDSLVRRMQEQGFPFCFVVTATDRSPRPEERNGHDYYFYSTDEFEQMIDRGEMLEHARVYGQHKGIPKAHVRHALNSGQDVVLRVDVQGAASVKALIPAAITIFVTCESEEELFCRLRARQSESDDMLRERLAIARQELARIAGFDYLVVNRRHGLDAAVADVLAIIQAEHCRAVPKRIDL